MIDFIEICKTYLDFELYTGAVLTDLSKAFDCLPHCLLICELSAYRATKKACRLLVSDRSQRVKMSKSKDNVSEWLTLTSRFFNRSLCIPYFINDLLSQMTRNSDGNIYNYVHDNTISACDKTIGDLHNTLTEI